MSTSARRETPAWQQALGDALTEALPRLIGEPAGPLVQELIAALTDALCRGELALDLAGPAPPGASAEAWPVGHRAALAETRLLRDPEGPLVLRGDQLAWRRWVERRDAVLAALMERVDGSAAAADPEAAGEEGLQGLDPLQARAVQTALRQRLVLLLGGPGTGKTSTVARLLAAVRRQEPGVRVQLAAPTGKAASRLRAATGGGEACATLHRLLESRGDGFGRHRHRPLDVDLLVVDELSMVDLELMEALLEALPARCRLVLVGDPAQLPPIAPGSVLQALEQPDVALALAPVRIELRTLYRNDGAIARVAAGLRAVIGETPGSRADIPDPHFSAAVELSALAAIGPLLEQLTPSDNLVWQQASSRQLPSVLLQRLSAHQRRLASLASGCWPGADQGWAELVAERDRLLVLSPLRVGRWGIDAIHRALLGPSATLPASGLPGWPSGTPVLCRRNRPALGLANGDLGVLVHSSAAGPGGERDCRLLFGQDSPLWLHPAQLAGALEPALAVTVHKAQGSEAREVIVLLEDEARAEARLLYTALTRAREQALLITAVAAP